MTAQYPGERVAGPFSSLPSLVFEGKGLRTAAHPQAFTATAGSPGVTSFPDWRLHESDGPLGIPGWGPVGVSDPEVAHVLGPSANTMWWAREPAFVPPPLLHDHASLYLGLGSADTRAWGFGSSGEPATSFTRFGQNPVTSVAGYRSPGDRWLPGGEAWGHQASSGVYCEWSGTLRWPYSMLFPLSRALTDVCRVTCCTL